MDTVNQNLLAKDFTNQPLAGGAWRLLAFFIDITFLGFIGKIINYATGFEYRQSWPTLTEVTAWETWLPLIVAAAYFILTLKYFNGSFGKMVTGLYVSKTDGDSLSWQDVVMREIIGKFISFATLGFGFLWLTWDAYKQGFHDKIADTVVRKYEKEPLKKEAQL